MDRKITAPFDKKISQELKAGDYVYITGTIYTARDAAHKRMDEALKKGEKLPFDVENNVIYYMGPSPAREGRPIGSAGPTTASRMDKYAPKLLDKGLIGMIGKGKRTEEAAKENRPRPRPGRSRRRTDLAADHVTVCYFYCPNWFLGKGML